MFKQPRMTVKLVSLPCDVAKSPRWGWCVISSTDVILDQGTVEETEFTARAAGQAALQALLH
jgi:hypothetical protein